MFKVDNANKRHEWVRNVLASLEPGKLLDVGAGEGIYREYCQHLEYVSQDFCQYDGQGDSAGLQNQVWDTSRIDIVSDIADMPVEDDSFDYILCTEVFEHIKYPVDALKEFIRILKPGGKVIITAPFCSLTHMSPYHMYSGFNRYWYQEVMKDIGFGDIRVESNGDWYEYMKQEVKRLPFMAKRYGHSGVSFLYKGLMLPMLIVLGFLQKRSDPNDELQCFGYHVTATKPQE